MTQTDPKTIAAAEEIRRELGFRMDGVICDATRDRIVKILERHFGARNNDQGAGNRKADEPSGGGDGASGTTAGQKPDRPPTCKPCGTCGGSGRVQEYNARYDDFDSVPCPACKPKCGRAYGNALHITWFCRLPWDHCGPCKPPPKDLHCDGLEQRAEPVDWDLITLESDLMYARGLTQIAESERDATVELVRGLRKPIDEAITCLIQLQDDTDDLAYANWAGEVTDDLWRALEKIKERK